VLFKEKNKMNNKELSYFEELVLDLFKDQDNELKVELNKQIEKEVIQLSAEYNIEPYLEKLVGLENEIKKLDTEKHEVIKILGIPTKDMQEKYHDKNKYAYFSRGVFNSDDVNSITKESAEYKVKNNLESYSFGKKMLALAKDKKESLLALRLVSTRTEVREFLAMMYEKFGKKLPI
jgi:hypothetical protein